MLDHARSWLGQKDLHLMGVDLSQPLVTGNDSAVFKGESLMGRSIAVKVFPYADLHTVKWYQKLTSRLAHKVNGLPETLKTNSDSRIFTWRVIPIDSIGLVNYQGKILPYSVSRFIEGNNLSDFSRTDAFWQAFNHQDNIKHWLKQVSGQFNDVIGSGRIKLGAVNIKVINNVLAISDVCMSVRSTKGGMAVSWS